MFRNRNKSKETCGINGFFFYIKHLHASVNIKFTVTSHISTMISLEIKKIIIVKKIKL